MSDAANETTLRTTVSVGSPGESQYTAHAGQRGVVEPRVERGASRRGVYREKYTYLPPTRACPPRRSPPPRPVERHRPTTACGCPFSRKPACVPPLKLEQRGGLSSVSSTEGWPSARGRQGLCIPQPPPPRSTHGNRHGPVRGRGCASGCSAAHPRHPYARARRACGGPRVPHGGQAHHGEGGRLVPAAGHEGRGEASCARSDPTPRGHWLAGFRRDGSQALATGVASGVRGLGDTRRSGRWE